MTLRQLPNLISILRLMLSVPIMVLLLFEHYWAALLVFIVASLSDGLDGYLARRFRWESVLGGVLDALADKFLMTVVLLTLAGKGLLPWWLVLVVLGRDAFIGLGALTYRLLIGPYRAAPSLASKVATSLLMVLIMVILAAQLPLVVPVPAELPRFLIPATLIAVVISGLGYVVHWGRSAYQAFAADDRLGR